LEMRQLIKQSWGGQAQEIARVRATALRGTV
jgi:hypothetical protein